MTGIDTYPATIIERYLRERGIEPKLTTHRIHILEAVVAEIIKENKMLRDRLERLEK